MCSIKLFILIFNLFELSYTNPYFAPITYPSSPYHMEISRIFAENQLNWPSKLDLHETIDAIIRLHYFYDLNVENLRLGKFSDKDKFLKEFREFKLEAYDCLEIGLRALQTNFFTIAIEWLELAQKILLENYEDKSTAISTVEDHLSDAYLLHDTALLRPEINLKLYTSHLIGSNETSGKRTKMKSLAFKTAVKGFKPTLNDKIGMDSNLNALCKGQELMTEKTKSRLYCIYKNYFMREKAEYLSNTPPIIQFYDAISDRKIQHFTTVSKGEIRNSARTYQAHDILNGVHFALNLDFKNISDPIIASIIGRISYLTQLADMGERALDIGFQMSTFPPGIIYPVHRDQLGDDEDSKFNFKLFGDRIATFTMYLTDVESGGKTVFVQALATATPVKGSAIFWFNSYRNGKFMPNVYHSGCPVIIGRKMILARWFDYYGQEKDYACTLNPNE